ncbi:hypothetical protein R1flu_024601 [Riccia fluitans]|uniref:Endonuclease/exonuclease/phosphatase n=1 Tax=Riccia fluitans TaxID=41844 RepID=A0ABD1XVE1_9MARC
MRRKWGGAFGSFGKHNKKKEGVGRKLTMGDDEKGGSSLVHGTGKLEVMDGSFNEDVEMVDNNKKMKIISWNVRGSVKAVRYLLNRSQKSIQVTPYKS